MINLVLPHERQAAGSHVSALRLGSPPSCRRNCTLRLFLAEKAYDFSMCVKLPHFPIKNIVNKELFNCGWRSGGEQAMIVDTNNDGGGVFLYHHHTWSMVFIVGLENCKHVQKIKQRPKMIHCGGYPVKTNSWHVLTGLCHETVQERAPAGACVQTKVCTV